MNEFKYIQIGLNISYYRKLQGYTQESFAEVADISRSYISAIEAPNIVKTISLEMLFKIADALRIEPYKLLEFRE
jgi:transcriptional regulator with XRE-family HTH domain